MRDFLLLYVNGQRYEIRGEDAFLSLSDFLRGRLGQTGTKVVCAEGDCGACTVLVGRPRSERIQYQSVDACIQFLYQLDCRHVVTVEGLSGTELHPVQAAMVDHHGSQCGFCTPGFVMALAAMHLADEKRDLRTSLTGNLCRCTGYVSILESAAATGAVAPLSDDGAMLDDLRRHASIPVAIDGSTVFRSPVSLDDAIAFKASRPDVAIVSGGTELGVVRNKTGAAPAAILSLMQTPGLDDFLVEEDAITMGANVTWTQVETFSRAAWPELHRLVARFGSPQIRNVGTLVGNIANGSPIADSLPLLCVMDASLEINGGARHVSINDFYKGYKTKDLAAGEIITRVRLPRPKPDEIVKLYKVSRRNDLDIATFGAAIRIQKSGDTIGRVALAYGGVAVTVVRLPRTEVFLSGKPFREETFAEAGLLARREIEPISDVRGSRDFRWQLAENILSKFYFDTSLCSPLPKGERGGACFKSCGGWRW